MAQIKLKLASTSLPASLSYRELGIYSNEVYFGNSSSVPVHLAKLHSNGALILDNLTGASYNEGIRINGPTTAWRGLFLGGDASSESGTGTYVWSVLRDNSGQFRITNNASSNAIIYANTAGQVGINNLTPSSALDVIGSIEATVDVTASGAYNTNTGDSYEKYNVYGNDGIYCIGMKSAQTYGYIEDWAMTFTMNAETDRGFLWRDSSDTAADGAASLTTDGKLKVKSLVESKQLNVADSNDVLKATMQYNLTTESLDFIFV